ncbi:hypothetical protein FBU30_004321 [Linnemannia zychae]|nr:hypothetical protein FBU30_004321 [Linnemannia zychae]
MAIQFSDRAPLPLQLQIESQVQGAQKLTYLPTTGPSIDFYYINYRPTYHADNTHSNKIDFWMLTPQGHPAPATGSLELFDEFGKIKLATLVPEGTKIPQAIANKNEPFLWASWTIPKTLAADFDFSDRFRIVLKTSDHIAAAKKAADTDTTNSANENNKQPQKRQFDQGNSMAWRDFLLVRNKNKHVTTADNASTLISTGTVPMVVQDRQFRIKGLKAIPGGKPNPAKMATVNSFLIPALSKTINNKNSSSASKFIANGPIHSIDNNNKKNPANNDQVDETVQTTGASSAAAPSFLVPTATTLLIAILAVTFSFSL